MSTLTRYALLPPLFAGTILFLLCVYPNCRTKWALNTIWEAFCSSPAIKGLSIFFGISLLRTINKTFSRLVLNNFTTDKNWDWSREIVLITGGSSGIGAFLVQMLAERNITVVILDVECPRLTATGPNVHFYEADITSASSLERAASAIRKQHGDPTVLVNNAGVGTNKTILGETEADLRRVFDVNTISHFLLAKEFLPAMIERNHGHIVTVASMASFFVHAQNVDYACTKASALAFHEGLAQELKGRYDAAKIRTTVVHPTWTRTPLIARLIARPNFKEFVLEPEAVAEAIVNQLLSGYGAQIILPARLSLVTTMRGMPSWLQEWVRNSATDVLRT